MTSLQLLAPTALPSWVLEKLMVLFVGKERVPGWKWQVEGQVTARPWLSPMSSGRNNICALPFIDA